MDEDTYNNDVSSLRKILSSEGDMILSNDDKAVIYIGRETCPYCQKFAKKLANVVDKIDTFIYYIDSSNSSDDNLASFRDKYNIITVPGFIVKKDDKFDVRCDSSIPEEEILHMVNN